MFTFCIFNYEKTFLILLTLVSISSYSQPKNGNFVLKKYINNPELDSLSIGDFLKENFIKLNSSALKIQSYTAYIFPCPGCLINDAQIIFVKGNTLKDKQLLTVLNKVKPKFDICFDNISFNNAKRELITLPQNFCVRIY